MKRRAALAMAHSFAYSAHAQQKDKGGAPYLDHVARVADRFTEDTDEHVIAVLHDVVEDSTYSLHDLTESGFSNRVVDAVDAITRREDETKPDYYARVRSNRLALRVKLADVHDNLEPTRLQKLDSSVRERLVRKYTDALPTLLADRL